jgi:hypothetical protein
VTPEQIERAIGDQAPTGEDVQRFADIMTASLGNLSPREGIAVMHAAIELALHVASELGSTDRSSLLAVFLLRECDADVSAAQRAVRQAKAKADAGIAEMMRRGST